MNQEHTLKIKKMYFSQKGDPFFRWNNQRFYFKEFHRLENSPDDYILNLSAFSYLKIKLTDEDNFQVMYGHC